jgi:YcxB-like protein
MELTFRLTREEYLRFVQLSVARVRQRARRATGWFSKPLVFTVAAVLLGLLPLVYLLFAELISPLAYFVGSFTYMCGALCVSLCTRLSQRMYLRYWLADDSPTLAEVRLKLVGDGIEAADPIRTGKYVWQAFREVSESGELVLLWFDRAQAVVIPGRAFANAEQRQSFIDTVRGHLSVAPTA